jgi:glycosyltransferase involved in cell wall biosynthesis
VSARHASDRAALMIYIEPTPYVLALIRRIASSTMMPIDVLFIAANVSQAWDLSVNEIAAGYLPKGTVAALRVIAAKLASARYRVVHLAGWGHPVLLGAMIVARLRGIPIAVETDSTFPVAQSWPKRAAKRLLYPIMLRIPSVMLPGGTRQKRYLRHYGVPEDRIVVAQMTVDVTAISSAMRSISTDVRRKWRAELGIGVDECVFLFVGRLAPAKGILVLISALAQLSACNSQVRLVIVGDGAQREEVRQATLESDRIRWTGRLTGMALLESYAASDVFVLPSLWEAWGLVVNEAMAAGLPVIVSDGVGCGDDLVSDGQTGLVVKSANVAELADAMARLAGDASARRAMGAAGRDRIAGWSIESEAAIVAGAWRRVSLP